MLIVFDFPMFVCFVQVQGLIDGTSNIVLVCENICGRLLSLTEKVVAPVQLSNEDIEELDTKAPLERTTDQLNALKLRGIQVNALKQ